MGLLPGRLLTLIGKLSLALAMGKMRRGFLMLVVMGLW